MLLESYCVYYLHYVQSFFSIKKLLVGAECVLRVGAAEDEEGASLGDRGDLLLLDQVGDDGPRSRWNLWVVLLPSRVVLLVLLAYRAARVRTQSRANPRVKQLRNALGYLLVLLVILFVSAGEGKD